MKNELNNDQIRKFIKEVIASSLDLKELDILLPKDKNKWKDDVGNLRSIMVDLMKNVESEDFADGVKKIDSAIKLLGTWKSKIEKLL